MEKFKEPELVFDVFLFETTYHITKKNKLKKHINSFSICFTGIINCN